MTSTPMPKKKGFAAVALRGLGCSTSSAKVHAPSAVKASTRRGSKRSGKEDDGDRSGSPQLPSGVGTGIGISEEEGVEIGRRGAMVVAEAEEIGRESLGSDCYLGTRPSSAGRRSSMIGSPTIVDEIPVFGLELGFPRHLRRSWRICRSSDVLEEMQLIMLDASIVLGEMDALDRHWDMRLDVDNMSYEELLELGDSIGYVNTGLKEGEITRCLRRTKHSIFNPLLKVSTETDRKCSICLDEYRLGDEVGKLECGHGYHTTCIKQWLLRKNSCPVCKAAVGKS